MKSLPPIRLDRSAEMPLSHQLAAALQDAILERALPAGTRLPSGRAFARRLGVSRAVVSAAYRDLIEAGLVSARTGAGTFITASAAELPFSDAGKAQLTGWGARAAVAGGSAATPTDRHARYDLGFSRIFPHTFPYAIWRQLLTRNLSTDDALLEQYGSPGGFAPLRRQIAATLARRRGIRCSAEQVVIVNGAQQALDILVRLLLSPGGGVIVEDPGYIQARELLRVAGAQIFPVGVDIDGLQTDRLPRGSNLRLAFVTPSNQFPCGGVLPLERRLALLRWAAAHDAFILEDDYDSELRYDGRFVPALFSQDRGGRVVYLGTFSKVLFPALRLAYVVLPPSLVDPFLAAKRLIDRGSPTLTQAAIADFIAEGHFVRHMQRLRRLYSRRRDALLHALHRHFGRRISFVDAPAGLHVMVTLPPDIDEAALVEAARAVDLALHPGAPYHVDQPARPTLLLAFSAISADRIEPAVERLRKLLEQSEALHELDA